MALPNLSKSQSCYESEGECPDPPFPPLPKPYPPPPPPPASHGPRTFVTALIIAGSVLAFLAVCLSMFLFVRRRRLRRREELLEAALAPAAPGAFPDDGDGDGPEGEGVTHHAWHIRTVGLDAAAIESIALAPYRAGGALGASDCTVCLGEFQDGELLRLLPKCGHAFHVQCIDTWLRAHVNCPLCRADVVDPAAEQPVSVVVPPPAADADASAQQFASNGSVEHGQPEQRADELQDLRGQSDQPDDRSSSLEERPRRHPGAPAQNFRRVASMDSPLPTASAEESLPEHDQADGEKQGTGGVVCCELSPGSAGHLNRPAMERSLSAGSRWRWASRHARARSSLLPL